MALADGNIYGQISIHALREEGDAEAVFKRSKALQFLSTPSARRATVPLFDALDRYVISIHALREEGDCPLTVIWLRIFYFYPRPPRGGRPCRRSHQRRACEFLSTPSARRATPKPPPL